MLIVAAVLLVWLVMAWLLSQLIGPHQIDQPQSLPHLHGSRTDGQRPATAGIPGQRPDRDVLRYLIASTVACW